MSVPAGSSPLAALSEAGVAVWLDDLSRELLAGGELEQLIAEKHVVGVTTNPTIFASVPSRGDRYTEQLRGVGDAGGSVDDAVFALTTDDVRSACDVLGPVYERRAGIDGRVSIEVDPRLAQDAGATVATARKLWEADGRDLADIHSVASFFVSRVDVEVDRRPDAIGSGEAPALKGRTAVADARLALQAYERLLVDPRWQSIRGGRRCPPPLVLRRAGVRRGREPGRRRGCCRGRPRPRPRA